MGAIFLARPVKTELQALQSLLQKVQGTHCALGWAEHTRISVCKSSKKWTLKGVGLLQRWQRQHTAALGDRHRTTMLLLFPRTFQPSVQSVLQHRLWNEESTILQNLTRRISSLTSPSQVRIHSWFHLNEL